MKTRRRRRREGKITERRHELGLDGVYSTEIVGRRNEQTKGTRRAQIYYIAATL